MSASNGSARFERREGWGMSVECVSRVVYPIAPKDVADALLAARRENKSVIAWGNGRSYGDAALNDGNVILDMSRMDRVVSWDRESGDIVVEPGLTLEKLWKSTLPDGYWPPVVSGTMTTTIGGLLSANAHGKNHFKHGPFGEHVQWFEIVLPDGTIKRVAPTSEDAVDRDLFHAVIGGFGLLGIVTKVAIHMKRVYSGRIGVEAFCADSLSAMFRGFEQKNAEEADYVVGWIDAFATGSSLGRGQVHAARYCKAGEDPEGERMYQLADQELPDMLLGVLPMGWLHKFARPFAHRPGLHLINSTRFAMMSNGPHGGHERFFQPHAQFNFLLDFVPRWRECLYEPGGLIQYQLFLPKDRAEDVARRVLELSQEAKLEPWLVVMKRHRPDAFWLSHALDGYSFALDYPVTDARREDLWRLTRQFNELVAEAGGRFYFAKDQVVSPDAVQRAFGKDVLERFFALKAKVDPTDLFQGNLWRRALAPLRTGAAAGGAKRTPVSSANSPATDAV